MRIAAAALRCFAGEGIANTSMADVIEESGLSAGSIYSHFENKADLVRFALSRALEVRFTGILDDVRFRDDEPTPEGILSRLLQASDVDADQARTLMQVWSEVAWDPGLATVAGENMTKLRAMVSALLQPWAETHITQPERASGLAQDISDALLTAMLGYAVRIALDPKADPAALRASLEATFAAQVSVPVNHTSPGGSW